MLEPGCFVGDAFVVEDEASCGIVRTGHCLPIAIMLLTLPNVMRKARGAASRWNVEQGEFGHCDCVGMR